MQTLKILVVDDDPVTRSLLQKRLTKENYEIELAENGVEAIEMVAKQHFDTVLTDLMMPGGVDGIEVLESVKKQNLKTEVILITANATVDNAIEAMKKGATDYLQKPINFDELLLRLQKIRNVKCLLKNANDLREAMDVTERNSSETIQKLELSVSKLETKMEDMRSTLARNDLHAEDRIKEALAILNTSKELAY
jgi:DNA-binding NtrC family response regulator